MTPATLASVVTNARAKVAAGNADYLDVAVVALADEVDRAWGALGKAHGERDNHESEVDAAVALLRETRRDYCRAFTVGSAMTDECESKPPCYEHRKAAILANHPAPAKATDGPKETTDE